MTFRLEDGMLVANDGGTRYSVTEPFRQVLTTLPDDEPIPRAIVMLGILSEQATPPASDDRDHLSHVIDNIDGVRVPEISQATVDSILRLVTHGRVLIPPSRKAHLSELLSEAELKTPSSGQKSSETRQNSDSMSTASSQGTKAADSESSRSGGESTNVRDGTTSDEPTNESSIRLDTDETGEATQTDERPDSERPSATEPNESTSQKKSTKYTTAGSNPLREPREAQESNDDISDSSYQCEFCGQPILEETTLITHAGQCDERPSGTRFECEQCGNLYTSRAALNRHEQDCEGESDEPEPVEYTCSNCSRSFSSRTDLKTHEKHCFKQLSQTSGTQQGNRDAVGFVNHFNNDRGFGFISVDNSTGKSRVDSSTDVFLHVSECSGNTPAAGDRIRFDIEISDEGPQAVNAVVEAGGRSGKIPDSDETFASTRLRWGEDT